MVQTAPGGAVPARVPLVPTSDPAAFEGLLFHLDKESKYFVEANGVRSDVFTMTVLDLPTVAQLELRTGSRRTPVSAAQSRLGRRRRRAARHGRDGSRRSVDEDECGSAAGERSARRPGAASGRIADGQLQDRETRVL